MSNQYANLTQAFSNYNPLKLSSKSMQPSRVGGRREKKPVAQAVGQWTFVIHSSPSSTMEYSSYPPSSSSLPCHGIKEEQRTGSSSKTLLIRASLLLLLGARHSIYSVMLFPVSSWSHPDLLKWTFIAQLTNNQRKLGESYEAGCEWLWPVIPVV